MNIFKRSNPAYVEPEQRQIDTLGRPIIEVNYESVLDYLVGLSDEDYKVINEVAVIYRQANADAAKAQGIENEPTSFITPPSNTELIPAHVNHIHPDSLLEDDDELTAAFLDDDASEFIATPKKKATKRNIDVKEKK